MRGLNPSKVVFLFGSGVSIPAGMPSTDDLTKLILSGDGIRWHTSDTFGFGQPLYAHMGCPDPYVPSIIKFLGRLKVEIDSYYQKEADKKINYEDYYYMVSQIHDSELREDDNPAIQPLIDKILPDIGSFLKNLPFDLLTRQTINYIKDIVWNSLLKEPTSMDYLDCLVEACKDHELSNIDIFTLNYDTILEQHLRNMEIIDGFGEPINKIRYWTPDLYENSTPKTRLYKLHGSINWFRLRFGNGDWEVGIVFDKDFWKLKDKSDQIIPYRDERPTFLAGTFNKMLEYTRGIYADLYYHLGRSLRNTNCLVVCGYGFGDKAINTRIIEWLEPPSDRTGKKLVIVHPESEKLKKFSRLAIQHHWNDWKGARNLIVVEKRVEQTNWQEVRAALFKD